MGRYKIYLVNFQIFVLTVSCVSTQGELITTPEPVEMTTEEVIEEVIPETISEIVVEKKIVADAEEEFNPASVSREYYLSTIEDVQIFIEKMNEIIKNQDYDAWTAVLSPDYLAEISSAQHLSEISELPAMKTRRITLKTAEDYFFYVVVPSRANSRVDDIEFINLHRVKAFTIHANRAGEEQRLLLYNLEKNGDLWKIIN